MAEFFVGTTDGVRGEAGVYPLDGMGAMQIGEAVGTQFAEPGETVLVGYDPRESSPCLAAGLATGITATGANVEIVGTIPTPGLAYLTRESNVSAGVMVTASHNPHTDNGIKVFDGNGNKLDDEAHAGIDALINSGTESRGRFGLWTPASGRAQEYADFLVASAGDARFDGLRIGIDTANGAASGIAEEVFARLGADVVPMGNKPDGRNINLNCGAPHLLEHGNEETTPLQEMVVENGLDMGAAFDGDADRAGMVDRFGRVVDGDHLMYILAAAGGHDGLVTTVMTNLGTERALRNKGIDVVRTKVGDRYVLEGLQATGYEVGGEQSGHIVLPHLLATGDGMLAVIQTIRAVRESGRTLDEWRDDVDLLPQALVNIRVDDKTLLGHEDARAYIAELEEQLGANGRVLIRPSGTEQKVRVMVEAPNAKEAATTAAAGLQRVLAGLSVS